MKRSVLRQINKTGKRADGAGLGEDCAVFPFPESGSVAVCVQEAAVLMNAAGRETSAAVPYKHLTLPTILRGLSDAVDNRVNILL